MDLLSYLPTWLTAMPVNLILIALVIVYVIAVLRDNFEESNHVDFIPELGVICGPDGACKRLAGSLRRAERFELAKSPEQVLEHAMRRNMVILFIVNEKLSGIADSVFMHLQNAYDVNATNKVYWKLRYVIFGIGDTMKEDFNHLAVELDLRLRKVGAKSVKPMRLFDVVTSTEGLEQEFFDFAKTFAPHGVEKLTGAPEDSESETSDSSDSDGNESFERSQEIEIVDSESETEEPVTESKESVVETPKTEAVEPVAEVTKPVVDIVEPETESDKRDPEAEARLEGAEKEADQADRANSSKSEKSEAEDDEDWEIIKAIPSTDKSS